SVHQQYGANALEVAENVRSTMEELKKYFPQGLQYSIPYNVTTFVDASIREVKITMLEAAFLVVIVVFAFLQSFRSTVIPMVALIVSIVGTFTGMLLLGLSINSLTLFGLVLAVGIVVDDAIVVIENVERNIRELKMHAKEACKKAMEEVTGPIIAIAFVLLAVFLPVTMLGGIAGQLYKQFAVTIAISVSISALVALTLSPALAALLIKPDHQPSKFAIWFNHSLQKATGYYSKGVSWLIVRTAVGLSLFFLLLFFIFILHKKVPTSFVPAEDQGYVMAVALLPDGASLSRSEAVTRQIETIVQKNPVIQDLVAITGYSLLEGINKTNAASYFIILKNWSERRDPANHATQVLKSLSASFFKIPEALILPFNPPSIQGLGTVGGFEFWIQNRGKGDLNSLQEATEKFLAAAATRPELSNLTTTIDTYAKQLYIDLDRTKSLSLNVPLSEVYQSLQVLLGSLYVNDFNKFGKV
ncbi:MAG TPA: efflux RND transporter permease subunit, partial [Parachlamydiaceae bacterium]|nr:efflux RND transporter permease subunit [Parachlamydiaceae bacterium]